jgi:hypothetical protein
VAVKANRQLFYHYASLVDEGGEAEEAGLYLGDWVVELDGNLVTRWCVAHGLPLVRQSSLNQSFDPSSAPPLFDFVLFFGSLV